MDLKAKVKRALKELGLAALKIEIERTASGKIAGVVISPSFQDYDQIDRQEMIWRKLEERLTDEEQLHVVSLITVTPLENADVAA